MFRKSSLLTVILAVVLATPCMVPCVWGQGDFVFRGELQSIAFIGENSALLQLKIAGFEAEVRVPESAQIRSASGQALELPELAVGSTLEVTADWIDGTFTAAALTVPEDEQVGAVGIIDALLPDRLTVSGTEFLLDENSSSWVGQLTAGQMAAVLGSVSWNSSLLATQIISQEQFWIIGKISMKDDAAKTITVASRTVFITDSTKILGTNKSALTFSGLTVGSYASVFGKTAAGKLTADEVRLVDINTRVEIQGQVVAYSSGSITIKSKDTPFVIQTDAKTEVVGTIAPGTMVSISAVLQPDGSLLAKRIASKTGTPPDVKARETSFSGILEGINAATATLVVQGITVQLAGGAVLRSGDRDILITNLKMGDYLKVTGTKRSDGSFLAIRVEVMPPQPGPSRGTGFDGTIESITISGAGGKIQVRGIAVLVSDKTVIQSGDRTIKIADLKIGDKVKISGTKQADGSWVALKIVMMPAGTPTTRPTSSFEGTIGSIAANSTNLVVNGITVLLTEKTVIQSDGKVIKVSDLKVGDRVKVQGQKMPNGSFDAAAISIVPPPPPRK